MVLQKDEEGVWLYKAVIFALMTDWTKFPPALPLEQIFSIENQAKFDHELGNHCFLKSARYSQGLTPSEFVFTTLSSIGGYIAGDGFNSIFHQILTPDSFGKICDALTEVGGIKLRDLLREAWSIYTKGKEPITVDELRSISVRRFNTRELMDRFEAIGEEVVKEIHEQHATGKVWSVEYAKRHRDDFEPIKY